MIPKSVRLLFRKELDLSVLTERRVLCPYGLHGGSPGARGVNSLVNILSRKIIFTLQGSFILV